MPAPMKFWELVSAFRHMEAELAEVVERPEWREPFGQHYRDFAALCEAQDRSVLDLDVPLELSAAVAERDGRKFARDATTGELRLVGSGKKPDWNRNEPMTAKQVHDRYGGSVLEEVAEKGVVVLPKSVTQKRRRRLGVGCLVVFLGLALGIVVLEWQLRARPGSVFGAAMAMQGMFEIEDGVRQLTPGWRGEQTVSGRTTAITINSRGMRGPEIPAPRSGEKRVLVLGDSMIFGQGVADDETVPARLQAELQTVMSHVVVGNAGVTGHGSRDMARGVDRHVWFDPDVVVVCTSLANDFMEDCVRHVDVVDGFVFSGPMARFARRSTRLRLALRFRTALLIEKLLSEHLSGLALELGEEPFSAEEEQSYALFPKEEARQLAGLFMDRKDDADPMVELAMQRVRESYRGIAKRLPSARILLVVIPTWWHLDRESWTAQLRGSGLLDGCEMGATQRRLVAIAGDSGLPVVDLTPLLREAPDRNELWLDGDGHFSAKGCGRVAAWLAPRVRRLLDR